MKPPLRYALLGVVVFALGQLPNALGYRDGLWLTVPLVLGMAAGFFWLMAFWEWRWSR